MMSRTRAVTGSPSMRISMAVRRFAA
jgi:hypothetical protein